VGSVKDEKEMNSFRTVGGLVGMQCNIKLLGMYERIDFDGEGHKCVS